MSALPDQADRDAAVKDTASSILVEASAGTGKTTTLVNRVLELALADGVPLSRIAAMTFTEKAAGEMKERLREALDEASVSTDPLRRARAVEARRDLEAAPISTLHAFCGRLLRERPVEAGVDPDFVTPEESVTEELLDALFAEWLDRVAREEGPIADALRLGLSPSELRALAGELYSDRALVLSGTLERDPLPFARREVLRLALAGSDLHDGIPGEGRDEKKALLLGAAVSELGEIAQASDEALAAFSPTVEISLMGGKRGLWSEELKEGVKEFRENVKELAVLLSGIPRSRLLASVAAAIVDGLFPAVEAEKSRRGILDFEDLLLRARDLLRVSPAAREHFRARFQTFIVDEFQDTDPVQAEIVLRLAAGEAEQDPVKWEELDPAGGALFLVGDPKQSIYRFRRADVETWRQVAARFGPAARKSLTTSFRAAPGLVSYVNAVFSRVFAGSDESWDVDYAPLCPSPDKAASASPNVLHLVPPEAGEEEPEEGADLRGLALEARAVANLLRERFAGRPRGWEGIAVLVSRNDSIDVFEEALREAGIPAVLEGGASFYRRQETAAVVQTLRAIDDPANGIAATAALKSFLFGLTDVELLDAVESGARLDAPDAGPIPGPVGDAFALLRRLRDARLARPLAETILDLLDSRAAFPSIRAGAVVHPVQAEANLERLVVLARALDGEGLSFREAVSRLVSRLPSVQAEPRAFEEKADAVRLITLHKSKGLEFDVVVLADLGFKLPEAAGRGRRLVYERCGGRWAIRASFAGARCGSPGFRFVDEGDGSRLRAEEKRLLYVAFTRAKETLVVSWFRTRRLKKDGEVSDSLDRSLLAPVSFAKDLGPEIAPLVESVPANLAPPRAIPPPPEAPREGDLSVAIDAAEARLARARATASRPLRRSGEKERPWVPAASAGPASHSPEDLPALERSEEIQERAVKLGTAVHEAMELLLDPARIPPASAADAVASTATVLEPASAAEAVALVSRLLSHPVVARARAARRRFVELPVLFRDDALEGSPLVEGKIDLLFEEADGWVVVDWKTDRVSTAAIRAEREALYVPQLASYARALAAVLGPGTVVKETILAFARG
ncbi:MAG: UvrD-helicase domain-containing protein [Holophagales bacterium]|nr:UvrD-helicase domain-containing protein [Holophagales bacterium]